MNHKKKNKFTVCDNNKPKSQLATSNQTHNSIPLRRARRIKNDQLEQQKPECSLSLLVLRLSCAFHVSATAPLIFRDVVM